MPNPLQWSLATAGFVTRDVIWGLAWVAAGLKAPTKLWCIITAKTSTFPKSRTKTVGDSFIVTEKMIVQVEN